MIPIESTAKLSTTALELLQEIYDTYTTSIIFQKFDNNPYFPIHFDEFDATKSDVDSYSKCLYYLESKGFIKISNDFTIDDLPLYTNEWDTTIQLTAKAIDFMEFESVSEKE